MDTSQIGRYPRHWITEHSITVSSKVFLAKEFAKSYRNRAQSVVPVWSSGLRSFNRSEKDVFSSRCLESRSGKKGDWNVNGG